MDWRDSDYRENPKRSIFVTGLIDQAMTDRLTPEIVKLRSESNDPISVYIDSPGGSTFHAHVLVSLLNSPNQDGQGCRIITVVTGTAASAAADILASGDYAIAYPHAIVHFHGVRTRFGDITHESASSLAEALKQSNEGFALDLADRIKGRFFFIYTQFRSELNSRKAENPNLSLVDRLASCVDAKLHRNKRIVTAALEKDQRLRKLRNEYKRRLTETNASFTRLAEQEAFLLRFLIEWELLENAGDEWRFGITGLNTLREDFVLLADFESGQHMADLDQHIREWGQFLLNEADRDAYSRLSEDLEGQAAFLKAKTAEEFRSVWHFLVSMCRALQQGENQLSPREAYWLGLVDEIPGSSLMNMREVLSFYEQASREAESTKKAVPGKVRKIAAGKKQEAVKRSTKQEKHSTA